MIGNNWTGRLEVLLGTFDITAVCNNWATLKHLATGIMIEAKIHANPDKDGIAGGRCSMLVAWEEREDKFYPGRPDEIEARYENGCWIVPPKSAAADRAYNELMILLAL